MTKMSGSVFQISSPPVWSDTADSAIVLLCLRSRDGDLCCFVLHDDISPVRHVLNRKVFLLR